jgi:hypothetical protein
MVHGVRLCHAEGGGGGGDAAARHEFQGVMNSAFFFEDDKITFSYGEGSAETRE